MRNLTSLPFSKPGLENVNTAVLSTSKPNLTTMSDHEILRSLKQKLARKQNSKQQINSNNLSQKWNLARSIIKIAIVSLAMLLILKTTFAQNGNAKTDTEKVPPSTNDMQIIKGIIKSVEDNQPLPGVNIYLKGSTTGTYSDESGKFEFPQKLKEGDVIVFSFVGLETQEFIVPKKINDVTEVPMMLNSIALLGDSQEGVYTKKESSFQKLISKVKGVF